MDEEGLPIAASAFEHGCTEAEIRFALAYRLRSIEHQGSHRVRMWVGPTPDGVLLEVGIADPDGASARVIHAMRARAKYLPTRRRWRDDG